MFPDEFENQQVVNGLPIQSKSAKVWTTL